MSEATAYQTWPVFDAAVTSAAHVLPCLPEATRRVLLCWGGDREAAATLRARGGEVAGVCAADEDASHLDEVVPGPLEEAAPAGAYDALIAFRAIEWLRAPEAVFTRLCSCLKPDGVLLAVVPNVQHYETVVALANGAWPFFDAAAPLRHPLRFYTAPELAGFVAGIGLRLEHVRPLSMTPRDALPRDASGCIEVGRVRIGPLNPPEYNMFLTQQYVVRARRPEIA